MTDLSFLSEELEKHQQKTGLTEYMGFEPFDIKPREEWIYDKAKEDGVDLRDPAIIRIIGDAPHPFQIGYIKNDTYLSVLLAGSQSGKSRVALVRAIAICTGVVPYSLQYDEGVDTCIARKVSFLNLRRWGRRMLDTGLWLTDYEKFRDFADKDEQLEAVARQEGWDCGNIIGVGKFPESLIAPEGSEVWIGTYQRAFQSMWNPNLFVKSGRPLMPETLVDTRRGNKGYSVRESVVYTIRNCAIRTITYESGVEKFEAYKAKEVILDEEPPSDDFYSAAQQRGNRISLVMTPYKGLTWSKPLIFGTHNLSTKRVFHCTQYDSPYCDRAEVEARRTNDPLYRRRARVWGLHGEQEGQPYFNRDKLDAWLTRLTPMFELGVFEADEPWSEIRGGLLDTEVQFLPQDREDNRYVWRVYEQPKEGVAYMLISDHAEGAEQHEDAGDWQTGMIMRPPTGKEKWPTVAALIRSSIPVSDFGDVCMMAARRYNNASLCPESDKRGAANAYFHAKVKDWPWFYSSTVERQSTRKAQKIRGFDTNASTREKIFKAIEDWMEDFGVDDAPTFFDDILLTELAQCVKSGKSGRADHRKDKNSKLDLAVTFGIGMFVLSHYADAIKCNRRPDVQAKRVSFMDMLRKGGEKPAQQFARKVFR